MAASLGVRQLKHRESWKGTAIHRGLEHGRSRYQVTTSENTVG
jgi:hypothetical protein